MATNLFEYYKSQGKALPSVAERATLYGDPNYTGTAEQNTAQLAKLQASAPAPEAPQQPAPNASPTTTPTPAPTPSPTITVPKNTEAENMLLNPVQPKTEEEIRFEKTKAVQSEIDSLNNYYDTLMTRRVDEEQVLGEKRDKQTNAMSVLSGLAGSSDATTKSRETSEYNTKQVSQAKNEVESQRAVAINEILSGIREESVEEAKQSRLESRESAETAIALREQKTQKMIDNVALLAGNGVTFEGLKQSNPEAFASMAQTVGGEEYLKAMLTLGRPIETILDKQIVDGKYIIAYQNPIDGKTRVETLDLGIPSGYNKTIDAGDKILFVPDNWSGDTSELISINKGLTPTQQRIGGGSSGGGGIGSGDEYIDESVADDPFIQSLLNTQGGKSLTDTSIQKLDKGLTVLGQLGVLQGNVESVKTGPILGLFREKNPWDTQAQTIKTSLNAIVPNLARGVYGEVGVLTDNDIATYSKTIPNLRSTEAVRNAVLYITLDMIGKSIKNTLSVNAAAGRDVSGFVDIYTEMEATKNSILSTIPGAQVPQSFQGQVAGGVSKGTMTNQEFRKKALADVSSIEYNNFATSAPEGQIPVLNNKTGQPGYISAGEFDDSLYTKI